MPAISRLGKADLHMHSRYSDGLGSIEDILAFVGQRTDLDVIAITDHNTIEGALRARDLARELGAPFEVIVGEEVSTREGHLLTLFIEKRIRPGLSVERTIELAHQQGGIAIIAHPFNRVFRHSIQRAVVERLIAAPPEARPDGIETLNGSFAGIGSSHLAMSRNRRHYRWPETGSSDAHTITAVGCAYTWFEGSCAADFRTSLLRAATVPGGHFWQTHDYWQLVSHWTRNGRPGHPSRAERLARLGERLGARLSQSPPFAPLRQVGQQVGQIARRPLAGRLSSRHSPTTDTDLAWFLAKPGRREPHDQPASSSSWEPPFQEHPLQRKGEKRPAPAPPEEQGWQHAQEPAISADHRHQAS